MRAAADRGPAGHVASREADCEGTLPVRAAGAGDCRVRHREDGRQGLRQRPPRVRRSGARSVRQSRQCGQGAQQCRYDSFLLVPAAHDRAYACAEGRWGRLSPVSWLPL